MRSILTVPLERHVMHGVRFMCLCLHGLILVIVRCSDLPPVDVPIKSGSPGLKVNRWDGDGLMGSELHRQRAEPFCREHRLQ